MKCNVENMLRKAGEAAARGDKQYGGMYNFSLHELGKNLRELHDRHKAGDAKAIDEFFEVYVFKELDTQRSGKKQPCPECGFKFDKPMPYGPQKWHDKQCSTCGRHYNSKGKWEEYG